MFFPEHILNVDNLSVIMIAMVGFISLCILSFSYRYLKGDTRQLYFYINLIVMVLSVFVMVSSDYLPLMLFTWSLSNTLLVSLMLHKKSWLAAKESAIIAAKNFSLGFLFLASSFIILYSVTGKTSIYEIANTNIESHWLQLSSFLIVLAAMTQSALWPFHKWLVSSLNSPTPVSAIMHAGLVNGGGFLLTRFSPIISKQIDVMNIIFIMGILTALLGTLWKLMQSDVKRMLACSTMGQMGFMIAQCGLGLFPAAVAHLCWHGFFKAYLFLASGSAAEEKRFDLDSSPSLKHLFMAILCGILGACMFSLTSDKDLFAGDTTLFLTAVAMIAGSQLALPIIRSGSIIGLPIALCVTPIMGALYGVSVYFIEKLLIPIGLLHPLPLDALHIFALASLFGAWLIILLARKPGGSMSNKSALRAYVKMLNASQPCAKTITAHRNHYQF